MQTLEGYPSKTVWISETFCDKRAKITVSHRDLLGFRVDLILGGKYDLILNLQMSVLRHFARNFVKKSLEAPESGSFRKQNRVKLCTSIP